MQTVMEKVVTTVNTIRSKGLNHRQFQAFLEDESEHDIYFCQVHWLSRAATIARFRSIHDDNKTFMIRKGKDVTFLDNDLWLNDLAFLVNITKFLSELNVKLQGKDQYTQRLYEHILTYTETLESTAKSENENIFLIFCQGLLKQSLIQNMLI